MTDTVHRPNANHATTWDQYQYTYVDDAVTAPTVPTSTPRASEVIYEASTGGATFECGVEDVAARNETTEYVRFYYYESAAGSGSGTITKDLKWNGSWLGTPDSTGVHGAWDYMQWDVTTDLSSGVTGNRLQIVTSGFIKGDATPDYAATYLFVRGAPTADVTYDATHQPRRGMHGNVAAHFAPHVTRRNVTDTTLSTRDAEYQTPRSQNRGALYELDPLAYPSAIRREGRIRGWELDGTADWIVAEALSVHGVNGFTVAGNTVENAQFSVFAWIRPTSVSSAQTVWSIWHASDTNKRSELAIDASGNLTGQVGDGLSAVKTLNTDGGTLTANKWVHVGITIHQGTADRCRRWLNGKQHGTEDSLSTLGAVYVNGSEATYCAFGARANGSGQSNYFGGNIGPIAIFPWEFRQGEVRRLYLESRRRPVWWNNRRWFNNALQPAPSVTGSPWYYYGQH